MSGDIISTTKSPITYNKDILFYHSRDDLTFCKPADLEKQHTVQNILNGWHQFVSPIPGPTLNHNCWGEKQKKKQERCKPHTCVYPFPANQTTGCYCLAACRPSNPKHCPDDRERKTDWKRKSRKWRRGAYLSQRLPEYPGAQLSQVGLPSDSRWQVGENLCQQRATHTMKMLFLAAFMLFHLQCDLCLRRGPFRSFSTGVAHWLLSLHRSTE